MNGQFGLGCTDPERKVRNHVRELNALGYTVTLNPAA
jgi:hypothetical protein